MIRKAVQADIPAVAAAGICALVKPIEEEAEAAA